MFTARKAAFLVMSLVTTLSHSAPGDRHFSRTERNRSSVSIPSTCIIKAKAIASSAIMTPTDRAASMAFISVLAQPGSSLRIDYALTPKVTQGSADVGSLRRQGLVLAKMPISPPRPIEGTNVPGFRPPSGADAAAVAPAQPAAPISSDEAVQGAGPNGAVSDTNTNTNTNSNSNSNDQPANPSAPSASTPADQNPNDSLGMTRISLTGYMGSTLINLIGVEGQSQSQAQVFNSIGEAQTISSNASIAANLVQTSSNQASIGLDILAGNIKRFITNLGIHSELRSQLDLQLNGAATLPATDLGVPTALSHALGLADIINHIDIQAMIMFDGTNLIVSTPVAAVGC